MKFYQVEVALFQYNRRPGGYDEEVVVTIRNCFAKQGRSWFGGSNVAGSKRWQNVLQNEHVN